MDQTDFSLLVGLLIGSPAGAIGLHAMTGWSGWISFLCGGILGLALVAAMTFAVTEHLGRRQGR
jgi:hypothetical protein